MFLSNLVLPKILSFQIFGLPINFFTSGRSYWTIQSLSSRRGFTRPRNITSSTGSSSRMGTRQMLAGHSHGFARGFSDVRMLRACKRKWMQRRSQFGQSKQYRLYIHVICFNSSIVSIADSWSRIPTLPLYCSPLCILTKQWKWSNSSCLLVSNAVFHPWNGELFKHEGYQEWLYDGSSWVKYE